MYLYVHILINMIGTVGSVVAGAAPAVAKLVKDTVVDLTGDVLFIQIDVYIYKSMCMSSCIYVFVLYLCNSFCCFKVVKDLISNICMYAFTYD
jgi:hypothetical protein